MSLNKRKVEESDSEENPKKAKVIHQEEGIQFPKEFNITNFLNKIRGDEFIAGNKLNIRRSVFV